MDFGKKAAGIVAAASVGAGPSGTRDGIVFSGGSRRAGAAGCGNWKIACDGGASFCWARDFCGRERPWVCECGEASEFWAGICASRIDFAGRERESDGLESVSVGDGRVGGDCVERSER